MTRSPRRGAARAAGVSGSPTLRHVARRGRRPEAGAALLSLVAALAVLAGSGCERVPATVLASKIEIIAVDQVEILDREVRGEVRIRWPKTRRFPCLDRASWESGERSMVATRSGDCESIDGQVHQTLYVETSAGVIATALEQPGADRGGGDARLEGTLDGEAFDVGGGGKLALETPDDLPVTLKGSGALAPARLRMVTPLPPRGEIVVPLTNPTAVRLELRTGTYRVLSSSQDVHQGPIETAPVLEPSATTELTIEVSSTSVLSLGLGSLQTGGVPAAEVEITLPVRVVGRSFVVTAGMTPLTSDQ